MRVIVTSAYSKDEAAVFLQSPVQQFLRKRCRLIDLAGAIHGWYLQAH